MRCWGDGVTADACNGCWVDFQGRCLAKMFDANVLFTAKEEDFLDQYTLENCYDYFKIYNFFQYNSYFIVEEIQEQFLRQFRVFNCLNGTYCPWVEAEQQQKSGNYEKHHSYDILLNLKGKTCIMASSRMLLKYGIRPARAVRPFSSTSQVGTPLKVFPKMSRFFLR